MGSVPISTSSQMTIAYNNGAYYIKAYTSSIMTVINSTSLTVLSNMSLVHINKARRIIFLNNSQTMVITSYGSNSLLFYNRSNVSPINYTYISSQLVNYTGPYGMWRVNDSLFYVTSYDDFALYSYSSHSNGLWKETLVFKISDQSRQSTIPIVSGSLSEQTQR